MGSAMAKVSDAFSRLSRRVGDATGSWQASLAAVTTILLWLVGGLIFGFGNTYQLLVNTGTTCITFIMVFLIQGAQNRDTKALHLKLDELLCAVKEANSQLVDIERGTDDEIDRALRDMKRRI